MCAPYRYRRTRPHYHELLFANQKALGKENLSKFAADLGLDGEAFDRCLGEASTRERIDADLAAARAVGASGTPAFFINGIPLSGALPLEEFTKVIDAELAKLPSTDEAAS